MAKVEVKPSGIVFDALDGEPIIRAAWRNGLSWPTVCEGQGNCKACVLRVLEGAEHASAISAWEEEGLEEIRGTLPDRGEGFRLACQITVNGDVVVHKIGVRPKPQGD